MAVPVRVHVCGVASYEAAKPVELAADLRGAGAPAPRHPCSRSRQLDVQAHAQLGMCARVGGRLLGARPIDHQAGAGDDAPLVRLDDPAVDARAEAEVVGVDDHVLRGLHLASARPGLAYAARSARTVRTQREVFVVAIESPLPELLRSDPCEGGDTGEDVAVRARPPRRRRRKPLRTVACTTPR